MNRRSFAKRGVAACAALLGSTSSLTAATERTRRPKQVAEVTKSSRQPDLEFEGPIPAGEDEFKWRQVWGRVTVPGLGLSGTKLDPDISKTRVCVAIRFMSRSVKVAATEIELLDNASEGRVLYRASRTEELGPERVVTKGRSIDIVRNWDDWRALWFDFPIDARAAKAIRVKVRLERA